LKILEKNWFKIPKFSIFNWKLEFLKTPLILRSSFSVEDWKNYSFAWIFESYFPIYNNTDLRVWINLCKEALKSNNSELYLKANNLENVYIKENFILQEYIIWDISGIVFSTYNDASIKVEYVPGINYWLTNWLIADPNIYIFDRNNFDNFDIEWVYSEDIYYTIQNSSVQKKSLKISNIHENIFFNIKDKLLNYVLQIENIFWCPQDIEFTVLNNDIYILQSRNITV